MEFDQDAQCDAGDKCLPSRYRRSLVEVSICQMCQMTHPPFKMSSPLDASQSVSNPLPARTHVACCVSSLDN
jgi:hypothetical protein